MCDCISVQQTLDLHNIVSPETLSYLKFYISQNTDFILLSLF